MSKTVIAAITLSATFFVMPKIVWAQVVINEIMYDLAGADDKHEWVELYNNGASPVDLTNWKFNDGDTATNHGLNAPPKNNSRGTMVLDADGYTLLADDAATLIADLPSYNGAIIDTVLNLTNTSATLKLLDKDGVEIATVSYNKDMGAAGNSRSLEWDNAALKESITDGGTPGQNNSVLASSSATPSAAPSGSSAPTSTATPSPTPAAGAGQPDYQYSQDILINEFLPWPSDEEKEWVELFNKSKASINLSGWQIDDADNSTNPQMIPADTTIPAGDFLIVAFNKSTLNNDGDKLRLIWPDDQIVHSISYDKAKQGQAVAKFDSGWFWTNQPTPGQANKKSFVGKNETMSLTSAPNNADKIIAVEEAVTAQTNAPARTAQLTQTPTSATAVSPTPSSTVPPNTNAPNPNFIAAASEPIKNNSKLSTILTLAGVIALSALAAGGLIYFRRQKTSWHWENGWLR